MYRIRKINLTRHVQAGGLTSELKQMALKTVSIGNGQPSFEFTPEMAEKVLEAEGEQRSYHDRLVLASVIEPSLTQEDLGTGELEDDPVLPAVDYDWLLAVAQGLTYEDGLGRRLWGPEPLSRYEIYRKHHGCSDDCEKCQGVVAEFMAHMEAE